MTHADPDLTIVLLPGMDGTGDLFEPFTRCTPRGFAPLVVPLPASGDYDALTGAVRDRLPSAGRFVLLAESFSGPLAVRLAATMRERVLAVIFCNSFVAAPRRAILRLLPWTLLLALPRRDALVRRLLTGRDASPELWAAVSRAIEQTPPRVLAQRMRAVFSLTDSAAPSGTPVLYLHGNDDRLVPERAIAAVAVRSARFVRKDIAGPHLLLQASPADAWREIIAFCADL